MKEARGMILDNILYVHDEWGAQWALEGVLDLAGRAQGRITLAACAGEASPDLLGATSMAASRLEEIAAEEKREELERMRSACGANAASVSVKVLRGRPFVAVIREVVRERHGLVAVAAPEHVGKAERLLLPSNALHLVRKCPAPVWVMRPSPAGLRRIGVAVDAEEEAERSALDRSLVGAGAALARACSATLTVFHTLFLHPSETTLRFRAGLGAEQVTAIADKARGRVERMLRELVTHASMPARSRVLEGRPTLEIPRFARQANLDLLVMGTAGRSGIAGLLIGNTAEEILQRVECSLLAIKPAGFVTPVG